MTRDEERRVDARMNRLRDQAMPAAIVVVVVVGELVKHWLTGGW